MPRIYDITVPLHTGLTVYPGNPEVRVDPQQEIAKGGSSNVSLLACGTHSGTHVDAPRHIVEGAAGIDAIPLDVLMGRALVVEFDDEVRAIDAAMLRAANVAGQQRVLFKTRNSALLRAGAPFDREYTYVAPDAAAYLVEIGVELVGVDYLSIEQFHSGHHMTHKTLLHAGVVIVEALDLSDSPAGEYELTCLPLRIANGDGAPARAVLVG